ncbi:MAG: hypothetical protein MJ002_01485 [Paludibacteraceae bacterium]|nr:hypothetical protein [Paludibacteraceae bacterium]
MSFDSVNIITFVTLTVSLVYFARTGYLYIRKKKTNENLDGNSVCQDDHYKRILDSTHFVETERQMNKGEHFDDETVYLNRANNIRLNTDFFDWVNCR